MSYFPAIPIQDGSSTILAKVKNDGTDNALVVVANRTEFPLPAAQISTLTPLSSVGVNNFPSGFDVNNFPSGFDVNNFPADYPLPAAQVITLTPPAAITNYALETGGNLATLAGGVTGSKYQIRSLTSASDSVEVKQATGTNLHTVVDSGSVTVNVISGFALETGGNLAAAKTDLDTLAAGVTGSKYQIRSLTSASDSVEAKQSNPANLKATVDFDIANESAFGTLEIGDLTPIIQTDFVYGLNTQIWQTPTVSGTGAAVDTNASKLRVQSGTNSAGFAYIQSRRPIRYRAGQGTVARFTPLFTTAAASNVQMVGMGTIVSNVPFDGYFFGYNGTAYGIFHYNNGTPTFIAQTSWNQDKVDGSAGTAFTLDPTKGTPHMIKYPYLGFGNISFFIQNPTNGLWVFVHQIQYANANTATQVTNPTLNFTVFTLNSGNTANKTVGVGSVGVFLSGTRSFIGNPKWATDSTKTGITTETVMVNIKNCTTYNGVTNRGLIRLHSIGFGTNTNTYGTVRLKIGATIGGSPSYAAVSGTTADGGVTITAGNSIASVDTAGTTVSGGTYIWNLPIGAAGVQLLDVTPFNIFIAPGEILTISLSAAANIAGALSVNWSEDI